MFPTDTKILIVDDSEEFRDLIAIQLSRLGYRNLLQADNGHTGLEMIREYEKKGENIGLILLDWHMPVMNGLNFLIGAKAGKVSRLIPVLVLTAENDVKEVIHAISAGAADYLVKPVENDELLREKMNTIWDRFILPSRSAGAGAKKP